MDEDAASTTLFWESEIYFTFLQGGAVFAFQILKTLDFFKLTNI